MSFRCGAAARWLPRALAAAIVTAATVAALSLDPHDVLASSTYVRTFVMLLGGLSALWAVRSGAEVHLTVALVPDGLELRRGSKTSKLPFGEIESLGYQAPFAVSRNWVPAAALFDKYGRTWRVPAMLADGERLIRELLRRSGRGDLETWAETTGLKRRMGRPRRLILGGYLAALALVVLSLVLFRG